MAGILSYPITYRNITLNRQFDATGAYQRQYDLSTYVVEQFDFSRLQVRDQREGLHIDTGGLLGPATKQLRYLSLQGSVRAESPEMLEDMVAALFNNFDVEEAQRDDPQYEGVHVLDFYTPTEQGGYSNPVRELFLARPTGFPRAYQRRTTGNTMAFGLELVCPDPRRYLFDITTVVFNATNGWSLALPNWAAGQGVEVYPYVLVNLIGVGPSDFTISDGTTSFVMDLSSETGPDDFAIDMQTGEISRNSDGAGRAYLRTSDVDTFLTIAPGGSTWTMTNLTNINEVQVVYRQART